MELSDFVPVCGSEILDTATALKSIILSLLWAKLPGIALRSLGWKVASLFFLYEVGVFKSTCQEVS